MEKALVKPTQKTLRDWISQSFEGRLSRNPHYSIRAFARDLGLDPAHLNLLLKGKKGLSMDRAEQIAEKLLLSETEKRLFLLTVKKERSRSFKDRAAADQELDQIPEQEKFFQTLTFDHYQMVADWHNTAILEYLRRPKASQAAKIIATQFQISEKQVTEAFGRLERLGWIKKVETRYRVTTGPVASPHGVPSEAIRKHHAQILQKAETALHFQTLNQRDFSSTELVIDTQDLPEIKKFLRETMTVFCQRFAKNATGDAVYEFSHQLFELGKIETDLSPRRKP